jgi:hypothetical protein
MPRFKRPVSTMRAVCLLALLVLLGFPITCVLYSGFRITRESVRLMHQTDHHRLLSACRELSENHNPGYGKYGAVQQKIFRPTADAEKNQLPKEILRLNPRYVVIYSDGMVNIIFLGEYGVYAYPKDYEPAFEGCEYGDDIIIDGLWLYGD